MLPHGALAAPEAPENSAFFIAQITDASPGQIDVTKDFVAGSRAAWSDINAKGGLRGKSVRHRVLEIDGQSLSTQMAVTALHQQPQCLALFGTTGDSVSSQLVDIMGQHMPDMAHIAPWLQNLETTRASNTFPIFASRQEQMFHAIRTLATMGLTEMGVVYASEAEHLAYRAGMEQSASALKIRLKSYSPKADLLRLGKSLDTNSPRVLIFLGGTPELAQFSQGMDKQVIPRYVIAMSDVNLQTLQEMGVSSQVAVIATQVVPMVNSSIPIVMDYRKTMARLYDEPPTPQSLAGFMAARYTFEMLRSVEGPLTRTNVLATLKKRSSMELGGFRIELKSKGYGGSYVTQSMISTNGGRPVG
jgi:ABC-type branched-subunit amino acid transport system substrate-binding protein